MQTLVSGLGGPVQNGTCLTSVSFLASDFKNRRTDSASGAGYTQLLDPRLECSGF